MTDRKDFKRIVRARARRTGESYSSALRNVRNARFATGTHEEGRPIAITRTIPDVRSTKTEATTRFYTELLGFQDVVAGGRVVAFVSPSDAAAEVTLNRDGFTMPPGFTVEVESVDEVRVLDESRRANQVRTIEELKADGSQFSVLDPSGRRVTIVARQGTPTAGGGDASRSITRAIPAVVTNDPAATRRFYVDYLGLELLRDHDGIMMFRSRTAPSVQVIASGRMANPDGFDLLVGSLDRLDEIHRAAQGRSVVLHAPADFPEHGVRCFMLLDPNGIGVNGAALLEAGPSGTIGTTVHHASFTSELAKTYAWRAEAFEALVAGTLAGRWSSPSPCEGWLARDVVSHVGEFSATVLGERGFENAPRYADFGGPLAAFQATKQFVAGVLDDPTTPPKVASFLHWSLSFDLPQHGWDLVPPLSRFASIFAPPIRLRTSHDLLQHDRSNGEERGKPFLMRHLPSPPARTRRWTPKR
jgi:catechol 2,3-dioxygenase-like lactoylglutathione lyase family enzyme